MTPRPPWKLLTLLLLLGLSLNLLLLLTALTGYLTGARMLHQIFTQAPQVPYASMLTWQLTWRMMTSPTRLAPLLLWNLLQAPKTSLRRPYASLLTWQLTWHLPTSAGCAYYPLVSSGTCRNRRKTCKSLGLQQLVRLDCLVHGKVQ
jgi:hypothetical protein